MMSLPSQTWVLYLSDLFYVTMDITYEDYDVWLKLPHKMQLKSLSFENHEG